MTYKPHWIEKSVWWGLITYRTKDDSGSSKITRVNNEEHHYRMVEITNKETGNYDVMMISTGDSFTMFPDMVKNQYEKYLNSK